MTPVSRRQFLRQARATSLFFASLAIAPPLRADSANARFELMHDPARRLDLPEGFSYRLIPETGGTMADGFLRPGRPDGMACFAHPTDANRVVLMRNHENWPDTDHGSPFGEDDALLGRIDRDRLYDFKESGDPFFGGVTRVVYDLRTGRLVEDRLALIGTTGNCSGGATPWGSWLSCEESDLAPGGGAQKPHGFVFEVPSDATAPVNPVPLTAMGRFTHEAAAVDPATGIVYMTEDARPGLFYRFLPDTPGQLARGGRLQALMVSGQPGLDTSNRPSDWGGGGADTIEPGRELAVEWIDLEDVEAPDGDLAARGHAAGAAQFYRGEGIDFGQRPGAATGEVFFNCTQGGVQRSGQVWRYTPGDGAGSDGARRDTLTLIHESQGPDYLDMCDNLAFAPWGDLILCEDGDGDNYLRGLTPDGTIYDFARNAHADKSEFCGACFSPDGRTLFVNVQEPGFTYAITGPWERLRAA